jgi:hypothetical protein
MIRQWQQVLPRRSVVILFGAVYALTYILDCYSVYLGTGIPPEAASVRLFVLVLASAACGFRRILFFHPSFDKRYRAWLTVGPWTVDKPLPLGPVSLTWADVLVVGVITLLVYLNGFCGSVLAVPAVVFLGAYVSLFALAPLPEKPRRVLVPAFVAPFTVYPLRELYVALAVLLALYVYCYLCFRHQFKNFPWNTEYWKGDPIKQLRKQAITRRVIRWPHDVLHNYEWAPAISFSMAMMASFMVTWWAHVIRWLVDEPHSMGLLVLATLVISLGRLLVYVGPGYMSPISLYGRILRFRWIIPGYDKVLIAPICVWLVFWGVVRIGIWLAVNPIWQFELSLFLMLLVALTFPPKLKRWRLVGSYRISTPPQRRGRVERRESFAQRA